MRYLKKGLTVTLVMGCLLLTAGPVMAQQNIDDLPTQVLPAAKEEGHPIVFYLTGDGGMKKFSSNLLASFAKRNYPCIGLNSLKYFWNKKTNEEASAAVAALITHYQQAWGKQPVILVGYSFGADVMPFIYSHLPASLQANVKQLVLLSPSASTDLQVHMADMIGKPVKRSLDVPAAINKISDKPLLLIFGDKEKDFDLKTLTIKNYKYIVLPGGHTYDEDANRVSNDIIAHLEEE
ncbi:virulence protein (VirJ) [Chitinophaga costaii]|uniref:Virulence protein (VirJ) n=1 Tax=Chitinophaga costaii TaxID=1335309 RepID=A0A1C4G1E6_9BACT|nr:AcvB/VirJ family lysyl-phosphatidylglycerol hydrolase [Chitinophaga costaii]PUZ19937.1 virulence factor family protein [Chitinophaga costaii]SCC61942.1 virulence protein (VirJ) [Chitinophaga costaii]